MARLPGIIGRQVRRLRREFGWTQADLAEHINMSLDMVGRIERGQASPSITTIGHLAESLNCEPVHLLMTSDIEFFPSETRHQAYSDFLEQLTNAQDPDLDWIIDSLTATLKKSNTRRIA